MAASMVSLDCNIYQKTEKKRINISIHKHADPLRWRESHAISINGGYIVSIYAVETIFACSFIRGFDLLRAQTFTNKA